MTKADIYEFKKQLIDFIYYFLLGKSEFFCVFSEELNRFFQIHIADLGNILTCDFHCESGVIKPCAAAFFALYRADETEDIGVPVTFQDLFHNVDYPFVVAFFARFCRDPRPFHAAFEGVLAKSDLYLLATEKYDVKLLFREVAKRRIDRKTVRTAHFVKDIESHLRIDYVAVRSGYLQSTLADRLFPVRDNEIGIEKILYPVSFARFAVTESRIEGKNRARNPRMTGEKNAQKVVDPRKSADS